MLSPDELRHIRRENERTLTDRLTHLRHSYTRGPIGQQVSTYTTMSSWPCGFAFSPFKFRSREILQGDRAPLAVSEILVRARLPQNAAGTFDADDRVVLTHKFGEEIEPQVYEVQGYEEITVYGVILNLRRSGAD